MNTVEALEDYLDGCSPNDVLMMYKRLVQMNWYEPMSIDPKVDAMRKAGFTEDRFEAYLERKLTK